MFGTLAAKKKREFEAESRILAARMRTKVGRAFPVRCLTGFLHDSPEGGRKKEKTPLRCQQASGY